MPSALRAAGYKIVTHKEKYEGKQGIQDPKILEDCGKDNMVLLTADGQLETLWAVEIEKSRAAVVILSNNQDGADKWGQRLETGKQEIQEKLRKYKKPCVLRFGVNSKVTHVRVYGARRAKLIKL